MFLAAFLANFIFAVSHLNIHPAVHLNTSKALASLYPKSKVILSLFLCSYSCLKKDKMINCG